MASDESLPREIISLCVAATYVWTHYCQITHIGLIGLNAHKQKHTQKTTTCEGLWATRLTFLDQNSSICCNCATEKQNSDSAEAAGNAFTCSLKSPNCTADDLQGQKPPRLACLLPLISCFLNHTEARWLMGPSYATACSCTLIFSFPHKSLPVLNLRRLKPSGCPTPPERQGSGRCYC